MTPFVTDIPVSDFQMNKSATIETVYNSPVQSYSTELFEKTYFLITNFENKIESPDYITYNDIFESELIDPKGISTVNLSSVFFHKSKPLGGKELEILNKTYNRLLSQSPTKL